MGAPAAKYLRPGQYVFHENDPAQSLFLVKKGTVAVRKRKGAAYIELGRIYSNEILGELSFFDRMPRSAAAIALTEVEVLEIPFDGLEKIFESVPSYMKTIVAAMAERLRKAGDTIRRLDDRTVKGDAEGTSTDTMTASDALAMVNGPEPGEAAKPEGEGEGEKP
jgi:CRP/FNR family transcriptional regulator, cyclic AMP receptor protein